MRTGTSAALQAKGKGHERRMNSYGLAECIERGAATIGWDRRATASSDGVLRRGMGVALAMQSSGIAGVDWGAAALKMNEDGSWNLTTGATDLGTGADTILVQIAAETLGDATVGVLEVISVLHEPVSRDLHFHRIPQRVLTILIAIGILPDFHVGRIEQ